MIDQPEMKEVKGYTLIERIGAGGFGAVYRAKQATVGREVAMKIILPSYANNSEFIRRFEFRSPYDCAIGAPAHHTID